MTIQKAGQPAVGITPEGGDFELIPGWAQLCSEVHKARPQVTREIRAGTFPPPIEIGRNSVAWWRSEIEEWKRTRPRRTYGRAAPEATLDNLAGAEPPGRHRGRLRRAADAVN